MNFSARAQGDVARVAIVIPCRDEARTIAAVVEGFLVSRPDAQIVVVDNASVDGTATVAKAAGATVMTVELAGKGHAVRAALGTVDADVIVLIDGDGTYDPADVDALVDPVVRGDADMVVGERLGGLAPSSISPVRRVGNRLLTTAVNALLGTHYRDVLSGYRALSRALARDMKLHTGGFEIETEMLAEAKRQHARIIEVPVAYRDPEPRDHSKLRPVLDGFRILRAGFSFRRTRRR